MPLEFNPFFNVYKRGILMYGHPGTGKTSIIHLLMKTAVEKDMIILLSPRPHYVPQIVNSVRAIEKSSRPFMVIWEEFEAWTEDYH